MMYMVEEQVKLFHDNDKILSKVRGGGLDIEITSSIDYDKCSTSPST